ncbi:type 1 glutamine amidotransferase [Kribbella pittospori]|uniref:Type 1 glutamine amidotransferase n=1 Tax=Kribbella pittospori TaxID=722689 RepID=A0A4R0L3C1_9ACTN|nr:type 1 glutamine amidotransferase [Kribbella pittospori]
MQPPHVNQRRRSLTAVNLLVVQPDELCPPGQLADWLSPFQVCRAYGGDPVPENADGLSGLIVLGGLPGVHDADRVPWLTPIMTLLADAVRQEVPTLGICLGHQLLAHALGGTVISRPQGQNSRVLRPVWTAEAALDPVVGPASAQLPAVAWNADTVAVPPPGAIELARSDDGDLLAFRIGRSAWGVQWHPEASYGIVKGWYDAQCRAGTARPELERGLAEIRAAETELSAAWRPLALAFAAAATGSREPA